MFHLSPIRKKTVIVATRLGPKRVLEVREGQSIVMIHVQSSEVQFHSLIPSLFMIMVGENLKTDPSVLRVRVIKFYSCVLHKYCTMCWDYSKYL